MPDSVNQLKNNRKSKTGDEPAEPITGPPNPFERAVSLAAGRRLSTGRRTALGPQPAAASLLARPPPLARRLAMGETEGGEERGRVRVGPPWEGQRVREGSN